MACFTTTESAERSIAIANLLKPLELTDLYKVLRLTEYAQSKIGYVLTATTGEHLDKAFEDLRGSLDLFNQLLAEDEDIIDGEEFITQIIGAKDAYERSAFCEEEFQQDQRRVRARLMNGIEGVGLLKAMHQVTLRLVRTDKLDTCEKAKLYLQHGTLPELDGDDVEALLYLRSRGIACQTQQKTFVNQWEGYLPQEAWCAGYRILRAAEHCHLPDIEQHWERWFNHFDQCVDRRSMDKIKAALILFDLCRSKYGVRVLGDDHGKVWSDTISFFNELYFNPADQREGPSAIIIAATLFAAQMTASPFVRIEMLEESLQALIEQQSRDGGWPYSQRMRNKLSVLATVIAVHAIVALKPEGWQEVVKRAVDWIKRVQCQSGFWSDIHFKNRVYLTVLALDAINLAAGNEKELSFPFGDLPVRKLSVVRPSPKAPDSEPAPKERRRGRGRRYSDKTLEKVNALHAKYSESYSQAEAWSKAAKECNMESGDAAKMQVRRYMRDRTQ